MFKSNVMAWFNKRLALFRRKKRSQDSPPPEQKAEDSYIAPRMARITEDRGFMVRCSASWGNFSSTVRDRLVPIVQPGFGLPWGVKDKYRVRSKDTQESPDIPDDTPKGILIGGDGPDTGRKSTGILIGGDGPERATDSGLSEDTPGGILIGGDGPDTGRKSTGILIGGDRPERATGNCSQNHSWKISAGYSASDHGPRMPRRSGTARRASSRPCPKSGRPNSLWLTSAF